MTLICGNSSTSAGLSARAAPVPTTSSMAKSAARRSALVERWAGMRSGIEQRCR